MEEQEFINNDEEKDETKSVTLKFLNELKQIKILLVKKFIFKMTLDLEKELSSERFNAILTILKIHEKNNIIHKKFLLFIKYELYFSI